VGLRNQTRRVPIYLPARWRPRARVQPAWPLEIDGTDLRREAWHVRRATLKSLFRKASKGIRLSEHIDGADGATVFAHACKLGLEGIVAKRRDRPHRSGRSADWIKVKNPDAPAAIRVIEG
jgi:ATP-dependent DNA ligase